MDENINKHLHDILDAIKEIESFFGDKPKYFNEFCNDLCLRRAVERDIEMSCPEIGLPILNYKDLQNNRPDTS